MVHYLVGILLRPAGSDELRRLFDDDTQIRGESRLLRSGPPCELSNDEMEELSDRDRTISLVAVDLTSGQYIAHASAHSRTTVARGRRATIELVLTHPQFEGRGVGMCVMIDLLRLVQRRWKARVIELTSEIGRESARGLYGRLGFEQRGSDRFVLPLGDEPWVPPESCQLNVDARNLRGIGSAAALEGEFAQQVADICCGVRGAGLYGHFIAITPIVAYAYKER
jgi:GNAT superfamily N-acetyltransferase